MYYQTTYQSPVGEILLVSRQNKLAGAWFVGQKYYMGHLAGYPKEQMGEVREEPILKAAVNWLDRYFAGEKPEIDTEMLCPEGTPFQQLVWELLCEIPHGEVVTYGELAKKAAGRLGRKTMSSQAVGQAVGHNPISIMIPCHRVIGGKGNLTGYAGGLDVKKWLLEHENDMRK